jgi:hypothetical protein
VSLRHLIVIRVQDFTDSPGFERFIEELRPWLGYVVEMHHDTATQVSSRRRPTHP